MIGSARRTRPSRAEILRKCLGDPALFARVVLGVRLRSYQQRAVAAIGRSVIHRSGRTFVLLMARQSGKNEVSACLEAWLLTRYARAGATAVKAAPTFRPQLLISQRRLRGLLKNRLTSGSVIESMGYRVAVGKAELEFLSAGGTASAAGHTASHLLEGDEAQDIDVDTWNRVFRPMGAVGNATTVLYGTAWTEDALIHVVEDSIPEEAVFRVPWGIVAAELPSYKAFVEGEIERLGADHVVILTQYEVLRQGSGVHSMFPPSAAELAQGTHAPQDGPLEGQWIALVVDVASGAMDGGDVARLDYTAAAAVLLERGRRGLNVYKVLARYQWHGVRHTDLHQALVVLAGHWRARRVVIDASGVGHGLATGLVGALGDRVRAVVLGPLAKSELGLDFQGIVGSRRFLDHAPNGCECRALFWQQMLSARAELREGGRLAWGVPPPGHDDHLVAAALVGRLESERLTTGESYVVEAEDVL